MAKRPNRERSIRRLTHDLRTVAFYCHRIPFLERESRRFSLDTLWKVKSAALYAVNRLLATVFKDYKVWSALVLRFLIHDHQCTLRIMTSVSNIEWYRNTGPPPLKEACISCSLYSFYNNRKRWFPLHQWVDLVSFIF